MKAEQKQSEPSSVNPKETLYAGMFYTFCVLTLLAFLFSAFGLDWFYSTVSIKEPPPIIQEIIKAGLKAFELVFVYKILTRKSFLLCIIISVLQSFLLGFVPVGMAQSMADLAVMFAIPLVFRKDRWWAIVDTIFLYALMCAYGALSVVGKFGEYTSSQVYSFYKNIMGMFDYKLFIVTLYLFVKYKGGIRIWKTKRKLLCP